MELLFDNIVTYCILRNMKTNLVALIIALAIIIIFFLAQFFSPLYWGGSCPICWAYVRLPEHAGHMNTVLSILIFKYVGIYLNADFGNGRCIARAF